MTQPGKHVHTCNSPRHPDLGRDARTTFARTRSCAEARTFNKMRRPLARKPRLPQSPTSAAAGRPWVCVSHANTLLGLVTVHRGGWVGKFSLDDQENLLMPSESGLFGFESNAGGL